MASDAEVEVVEAEAVEWAAVVSALVHVATVVDSVDRSEIVDLSSYIFLGTHTIARHVVVRGSHLGLRRTVQFQILKLQQLARDRAPDLSCCTPLVVHYIQFQQRTPHWKIHRRRKILCAFGS